MTRCTGYGAIATGHAAELKRSYAPELNVVGVAEGGIPADLSAALKMANGNLSAGLIFAGAMGVDGRGEHLAVMHTASRHGCRHAVIDNVVAPTNGNSCDRAATGTCRPP